MQGSNGSHMGGARPERHYFLTNPKDPHSHRNGFSAKFLWEQQGMAD